MEQNLDMSRSQGLSAQGAAQVGAYQPVQMPQSSPYPQSRPSFPQAPAAYQGVPYTTPIPQPQYGPSPQPTAFGYGGMAPMPSAVPQTSNGIATCALVLGIITLVASTAGIFIGGLIVAPFTGIAAIACGIVGIAKSKATGHGTGPAIAGTILGTLGFFLAVLLFATLGVLVGFSGVEGREASDASVSAEESASTELPADADEGGAVDGNEPVPNPGQDAAAAAPEDAGGDTSLVAAHSWRVISKDGQHAFDLAFDGTTYSLTRPDGTTEEGQSTILMDAAAADYMRDAYSYGDAVTGLTEQVSTISAATGTDVHLFAFVAQPEGGDRGQMHPWDGYVMPGDSMMVLIDEETGNVYYAYDMAVTAEENQIGYESVHAFWVAYIERHVTRQEEAA